MKKEEEKSLRIKDFSSEAKGEDFHWEGQNGDKAKNEQNGDFIEFCYKPNHRRGFTTQIKCTKHYFANLFAKPKVSCNEDKYKDTREKSSAGMIILSTLNDNSVITDNKIVKLTPGVVKIQSHSSCKEADMEYKTAAVIDLDNPKIKYADGSVKYRQIVTTKTVNKIKKRLDELGINYILAPSYSDKPQEDIRNIHIIILYASGVHKDKHQQAMQTIYKLIFLSDDKDILAKEYGVDTALNRISQGVYLPVVKKVNFAAYNETLDIVMNRKSLDINAIIDGRMISTKLENNSIKNTKKY